MDSTLASAIITIPGFKVLNDVPQPYQMIRASIFPTVLPQSALLDAVT